MRFGRFAVLAAGVSMALALAACGDDSGSASATTGGGAATSAARWCSHDRCGGASGKCVVGVSWNNYQEERWAKFDEPAIKAAVEAGGGSYISNDAKSSAETQASNVENLISQGANVLIILAQDGTAIKPSVESAIAARRPGHRVRPPHRRPEGALHHLRQRRGRSPAGTRPSSAPCRRATTSSSRATRPTPTPTSCAAAWTRSSLTRSPGRHQDRRRDLHRQLGSREGPDRDGAVPDGEQQRRPGRALRERRHGRGVVSALQAQSLAGKVPVSGQDGDQAALNRVALGTQTVVGVEGRPRARQGSRRSRHRAVREP